MSGRPWGRVLFVLALAAIGLVPAVTGWLVTAPCLPEWREQAIQQAVADSAGPAFWWPAGWRSEYQVRKAARDLRSATLAEYQAKRRAAQSLVERGAIELERIEAELHAMQARADQ